MLLSVLHAPFANKYPHSGTGAAVGKGVRLPKRNGLRHGRKGKTVRTKKML